MGERSGEGLPGTIPNPEVKLTSAEGTARATAWERTSLPTLPSSCCLFPCLDQYGYCRASSLF